MSDLTNWSTTEYGPPTPSETRVQHFASAPVDEELASALAAAPVNMGVLFDTLSHETLGAVRAAGSSAPPQVLSDRVERVDLEVPNGDGLVLRVHCPIGVTDSLPCVFWMHGGGLVLGRTSTDDSRFDRWCDQMKCVGVSVDYRLAPETPFPGPLEDCFHGLTWVHREAEKLRIDPARIGVGGASSGGGLAAALALLACDRGEFPIAFQLLIYPMLDDRQITVSSNCATRSGLRMRTALLGRAIWGTGWVETMFRYTPLPLERPTWLDFLRP